MVPSWRYDTIRYFIVTVRYDTMIQNVPCYHGDTIRYDAHDAPRYQHATMAVSLIPLVGAISGQSMSGSAVQLFGNSSQVTSEDYHETVRTAVTISHDGTSQTHDMIRYETI